MKTLLRFGYGLVLGGAALAAAFAVMLRLHTPPAQAFGFFLFFLVLQWISTLSFRREMLPRFAVGVVLCMMSAFWVLQSTAPAFAEDRGPADAWSFAWRSGLVLLVLLFVPRGAEDLASRSMRRFDRAAS